MYLDAWTPVYPSLPFVRACRAVAVVVLVAAFPAFAAPPVVPSSADASRIDKRNTMSAPPSELTTPGKPMTVMPFAEPPEQSHRITLVLKAVKVHGMTVFSEEQASDIWAPYLHQKITMDKLWLFAGQLTERYRAKGYFLSKVTIPQQEVSDGVITLEVIEGYIGEVKFDDPLAKKSIVQDWLERLKLYRPLKSEQIESVMLQLNDIPGVSLRAVLEPMPAGSPVGAVRLILEQRPVNRVSGQVSVDNNGSKFLGPYQAFAQVSAEVLPQQKTTFTLLSSLPAKELKYGGLKHEIPVIPAGTLELYGTRTGAKPGYTLAPSEIKTDSTLLGAGFNYKLIRQRQENLTARVAFESRETQSDILNTPLTRDSIRALRAGLTYETVDGWNGYDQMGATLSQGVKALGASRAGQLNLSRAKATPDFTKFEANIARIQGIGSSWMVATNASAQVANGPLYSSEEFGYGGQAFGRAYDDSEITGDHGVAASAELRYAGLAPWYGVQAMPYSFYDYGVVWNDDTPDQPARAAGSSAGAGLRLQSDLGISANLGIAFPLSRDVGNPLYGNGKNPRYLMQLGYGF